MRLDVFKTHAAFSFLQRVQLAIINRMLGFVPGPITISTYRRKLFGAAFTDLLTPVMGAKGYWTPAQREIVASFASRRGGCQF